MRRYLVVDDNVSFAENLAEILADTGAEVDVARDGAEALERLEATRYDLVISDMRMPVMSGAELAHKLRERHPGTPLVVITAYINDADLQAAREEGVLGILPKPAPIRKLLELCASARHGGLVALIPGEPGLPEHIGDALNRRGFTAVAVDPEGGPERLAHLRPFAALMHAGSTAALELVSATTPGIRSVVIALERPAAAEDVVAAVEELYRSPDA